MQERSLDHKIITGLLVLSALLQLFYFFIFLRIRGFSDFYTLFSLLMGMVFLIAAYGLWNFKLWGFIITTILYILKIVEGVVTFSIVSILIPAIILVWLFRNRKKFL